MNCRISYIFLLLTGIFAAGCGSYKQGPANENNDSNKVSNLFNDSIFSPGGGISKGIGKFKDVRIAQPLNEAMIKKAQPIFDVKCFACHKLTDEKLVGPGWKGVTGRRTPEWIMNFITNTDV